MRLDEYRKAKELSQRQFGELLEPPVSPGLVSQWECGVTRVTLDYAHEIQSKTANRVTTQDCAAMFIEPQRREKASV